MDMSICWCGMMMTVITNSGKMMCGLDEIGQG